jgi:hypothetical protein
MTDAFLVMGTVLVVWWVLTHGGDDHPPGSDGPEGVAH